MHNTEKSVHSKLTFNRFYCIIITVIINFIFIGPNAMHKQWSLGITWKAPMILSNRKLRVKSSTYNHFVLFYLYVVTCVFFFFQANLWHSSYFVSKGTTVPYFNTIKYSNRAVISCQVVMMLEMKSTQACIKK